MGLIMVIIILLVFVFVLLIRRKSRNRIGAGSGAQIPLQPVETGGHPSTTPIIPIVKQGEMKGPSIQKEKTCTHCMGRGKVQTTCPWCHGMGRKVCGACGGSGGMMRSVFEFGKYVTKRVPCGSCGGSGRQMCSCGGSGKTWSGQCTYCHGTGKIPMSAL